MLEQRGFPECFFTFSIAENQLPWISKILKVFFEWDESPFSVKKDKIKGTEQLQTVELTAQYSTAVVDIFVQLMDFLIYHIFSIDMDTKKQKSCTVVNDFNENMIDYIKN